MLFYDGVVKIFLNEEVEKSELSCFGIAGISFYLSCFID